MKLTKTQQALLDNTKTHGGQYSIDCFSGRGTKGGMVSGGQRNRAAIHGLVKLGLVEITHTHRSVDCNRGYSVWSTIVAFRVL